MRLRFVTTNPGKLREARQALAPLGIDVVSFPARIEEIQAKRLEDVARAKARALLAKVPPPFFVEDAGLFIGSLGGFPGVYSRQALETIGTKGVLKLLRDKTGAGRRAEFRAVLAYVDPDKRIRLVGGVVPGTISRSERGDQGFGFDPIFVPRGSRRTFAQHTPQEKSETSHRGRALARLARLLRPRRG